MNLIRIIESLATVIFFVVFSALILVLVPQLLDNIWIFIVVLPVAMLSADFISGVVHWAADTWGSDETPIWGPTLIRHFRIHHEDAAAIVRHDFIETNGLAFLAVIPILVVAFHFALQSTVVSLCVAAYLAEFCLFLAFTNEIHKRAHEECPPTPFRWLQRMGLILSREAHQHHHAAPFAQAYCITTGWLNPLLSSLGVFERLEAVIERFFKIRPRVF